MRRGPHPQSSPSAASELPSWARLDERFEDVHIVALDPRRTTVSRVHESMRVVYLRLNRAPDRFWVRLFRENRDQRTNPLRFGLWIEDEWISFDCRIDDIETSHVPDIEASIEYANRRYREVLEERRAKRDAPVDEGPSEAAKLDALAARLRERFAGDGAAAHDHASSPASAPDAAHARAVPTSRMQAPTEPLGDEAEREEWHRRLGLETLVTTGSRISVFGPHDRGNDATNPPEAARTLLREVELGSFEIEWSEPAPAPAPAPVVEPPRLAPAPAPAPDAAAPDSDDPTLEFERRRAALRMRLRAAAQSGGDDIPRGDE
ncbi:MAG TPA: hypothetical protein VFO79_14010 [Xanthomonadales bacterium]|nr:hypothetical protein [Xanthomonadales bacterium]